VVCIRIWTCVPVSVRLEDLLDAGCGKTLEPHNEHVGFAFPIVRKVGALLLLLLFFFLFIAGRSRLYEYGVCQRGWK